MKDRPTRPSADDRGGDYLWDRSGPVDPDVRRLEETLGTLRHREGDVVATIGRRRGVIPLMAGAAAIVALVALVRWIDVSRHPALEGWAVAQQAGSPTIDDQAMGGRGMLRIGQWLETDADDEAEVTVADIGSVTVHPNSRLRLAASRQDREHRLELVHGRIDALIMAPPRLFFVDTASAVAVDLGCAYALEVDEAGNGRLEVSSGWVALERGSRAVEVPADAVCTLRAELGPGTPHFPDAAPPWREALDRFDFETDAEGALGEVLDGARPRDTLSLWHLLSATSGEDRSAVVARLAALSPLPESVTERGLMKLDDGMMDAMWREVRGLW